MVVGSGTPTPAYTLFDPICNECLEKGDLIRIANGTASVLRVKNFFDHGLCGTISANLTKAELGAYDEKVVTPRIAKLGPAVYDYYLDAELGEDYWRHRDQSNDHRARLLETGDPLDIAIRGLSRAWGGPVEKATIGGEKLFAGMVREINSSARIHFDEIERELPGSLDCSPLVQLAFNCFIDMPREGGEVTVFRRKWLPSDENHRDGYGYSEFLVKNEPAISIRPEIGDAIFFDPRNYHRVESNRSEGRRITLSFFVGIKSDGSLMIWS
ncbi:hypothetical protein [Modicisalibacter coralii]|uniref:2OG-Fe(II)-dependent halogenase WelO5 family protein n=1 Tax=Modicisalibacter coralii TaxID=2304602 RepID=UPI00100BB76E|nr:hypothetical protein [Halomonas coralii]